MREYTYDELQSMQEKALERVRNMQQHSREMVEETNREMYAAAAPAAPVPPKATAPHEKRSGRIKMPLNLPEDRDITYPTFREYFAPENEKAQKQAEQKTKASLLDTVLQEPDEAVLFSLLLLLKSEGADEALMMALLYIMS